MSIAMLATGDEIIQGDTLNTNGHHIAQALNSEGLRLGLQLTCGDDNASLMRCIDFLCHDHDTLILIGGLGPTSDDRTRFALAACLNLPLIEYPAALTHITTRLNRAGLSLNPGNRQQSLFPSNTTLLPNPNGTAMGGLFVWQKKTFILLPGPPRECLPMFNTSVLPLLQQTVTSSEVQRLTWRLFGVAEGEIAEKLDAALENMPCHTGYRLDTPYLEFKVFCSPSLSEQVKHIIDPLVSPHQIGSLEQKASEQLQSLMDTLTVPISIIDEATGGHLQRLLQRPSNYRQLMFHESDSAGFHFHITGLADYWLQHTPSTAITTLTIHYRYQNKHGVETHEIPYRNALVLDYAAEWLSFRLMHLLHQ